jgi:hypothetical protein
MMAGMKEFQKGKWAPAVFVLAAMIGLNCVGCGNVNYQEGVNKANDELKSGTACIYTISMADVGKTDPKTGLPYFVVESSITPELLKMIEGHNETIYGSYHGNVAP